MVSNTSPIECWENIQLLLGVHQLSSSVAVLYNWTSLSHRCMYFITIHCPPMNNSYKLYTLFVNFTTAFLILTNEWTLHPIASGWNFMVDNIQTIENNSTIRTPGALQSCNHGRVHKRVVPQAEKGGHSWSQGRDVVSTNTMAFMREACWCVSC